MGFLCFSDLNRNTKKHHRRLEGIIISRCISSVLSYRPWTLLLHDRNRSEYRVRCYQRWRGTHVLLLFVFSFLFLALCVLYPFRPSLVAQTLVRRLLRGFVWTKKKESSVPGMVGAVQYVQQYLGWNKWISLSKRGSSFHSFL